MSSANIAAILSSGRGVKKNDFSYRYLSVRGWDWLFNSQVTTSEWQGQDKKIDVCTLKPGFSQ